MSNNFVRISPFLSARRVPISCVSPASPQYGWAPLQPGTLWHDTCSLSYLTHICTQTSPVTSNSHFEEEHVRHRTSGQIFLGAQASRLLRKRPRWPRSQGTRERSRPATAVVCLADSQNENCCTALRRDWMSSSSHAILLPPAALARHHVLLRRASESVPDCVCSLTATHLSTESS